MNHLRLAVLPVLLLLVLAAPTAQAGSDVCNNVCTNDETLSCPPSNCNFGTCVAGMCTLNPNVGCQTDDDCVGACGVCSFQGLRIEALGQALLSINAIGRLVVANIGSGDTMGVPVDGVRFGYPPSGGLGREGHEPWIELGSADWEEVGEPPDTGDAEIRVTPKDAMVSDGGGNFIDAAGIVSRMFDEAQCSNDGASCKKDGDCGSGNTCVDQSRVCSDDASVACTADADCGSGNTCVDIMKISVDFSSTQPTSTRYVVRDSGGTAVLDRHGPGSETSPVLARDWPAGMRFSEYKWEADVSLTVTKNVCSNDATANCQADGDCTGGGTCSDTALETVTGRSLEIIPVSPTYNDVVLGTCSNDSSVGCDSDSDCGAGNTCEQDEENKADVTLKNIDTEVQTGFAGPVILPDTFVIIRLGLCDDGNACTVGDRLVNGVCTGVARICSDANPCTDDACNPATGCTFTNNTNSCNDFNACTTGETCSGGVCGGGSSVDCNDNDICTADSCHPSTGCSYWVPDPDCYPDVRIPALPGRWGLGVVALALMALLAWLLHRRGAG